MARYPDILKKAVASAPWEARSVNGAHHDRVDWFAADAEGFPFPIARISDRSYLEEGPFEDVAQGRWGYFELSGQPSAATGNVNRWSAPDAIAYAATPALEPLRSLARTAQRNRVLQMADAKPAPHYRAARTDERDAAGGLAALAALAECARTAGEQADETGTAPVEPRSAGEQALAALAKLATGAGGGSSRVTNEGTVPSDGGEAQALAALAALAKQAKAEPTADRGNAAESGSFAEPAASPRSTALAYDAASHFAPRGELSSAEEHAAAKNVFEAQPSPSPEPASAKGGETPHRIVVVGVDDPFTAHLLRGCLLASAERGRPLSGLEGIVSEQDLEGCSGSVYLSYDRGRSTRSVGIAAAASLDAFGAEDADAEACSGLLYPLEYSFAVLDFVGSDWVEETLPSTFTETLAKARCTVVLAEPAREYAWNNLTDLLVRAQEAASPHPSLGFFEVGSHVSARSRSLRRFLRAWWSWFGNGSRSGFFELASALDRAMGLLGFNLQRSVSDLGLISILSAQIRDGGTIASADDIADALADRFPDREQLQAIVDAAMRLLVAGKSETSDDRVFLSAEQFLYWLALDSRTAGSSSIVSALCSSPSLQALFNLQAFRLEIRFSALFACLAARWFLRDPARSLLQVADSLDDLAESVPSGGWGQIALQTVLLAEQHGQSFAGRVILERLFERADDEQRRDILVEISLGVFLDASDGLPSLWLKSFFNGSINTEQTRILREAREAGWLRSENLLVMRRGTDELYRRAQEGESIGIDPIDMVKSCHWMDLLLRAVEAASGADLVDQIVAGIRNGGEERVRALGRYDCLIWACQFGVELPCSLSRSDFMRRSAWEAVRDAAGAELSGPGPAYAECARFAWLYGMERPSFSEETWERIRHVAVRIVAETTGDDDAAVERRIGAYRALAACALRNAHDPGFSGEHAEPDVTENVHPGSTEHIEPSITDISEPGSVGDAEPKPFDGLEALLSPSITFQTEHDLRLFVNSGRSETTLYLLMALTVVSTLSPASAVERYLHLFGVSKKRGMVRLLLSLFAPNQAKGRAQGKSSEQAPSVENEAPTRDTSRVADLHRRWKACVEKLTGRRR